jgi:hypothetical protein
MTAIKAETNYWITLDWDIEFSTVRDSVSFGILRRFGRMNRGFVVQMFIRSSAHGNTHVKIKLVYDVDEEMKFQIRAYLRDDPLRLRLDQTRYLIEANLLKLNLGEWKPAGAGGTGRLWDWKVEDSKGMDAGDWEEVRF